MASGEETQESSVGDKQLRKAVDVEAIGDKLYRSLVLDKPERYRSVYGGLVMSQALMAATKSVSTLHTDFLLHSFHCYFVSPTKTDPPVIYKVGHAKDGRNFCTIAVKAMQGDKINFHCMASFYKPMSSIISYQAHQMPAVPRPGESTLGTQYTMYNVSELFPVRLDFVLMDIIMVAPEGYRQAFVDLKEFPPQSIAWIRGSGTFGPSDPQNYHRIAIVYASDMLLARLVLNKYPGLRIDLITSLDHSIWFHSSVQADQWYLYVAEADRSLNGRSLNICRVYGEDGTMVATCTQESLIKPKL